MAVTALIFGLAQYVFASQLLFVPQNIFAAVTSDPPFERHVRAMGTDLLIRLDGMPRAEALVLSERMVADVAATEARISTWRESSEFSRWNHAPLDHPFELSAQSRQDLKAVLELGEQTGWKFHPFLGAPIEKMGIRRCKTAGAEACPKALSASDRSSLLQALEPTHLFANREKLLRASAQVQIEEGGFGKGLALDRIKTLLEKDPSMGLAQVHVNFGGQTLDWSGSRVKQSAQPRVSLAYPDSSRRPFLEIAIREGAISVSTSGNAEQPHGHILDPSTLQLSFHALSATVLDANPLAADALSKALFLSGAEEGFKNISSHRDLILVESPKKVHLSCGLRGRVQPAPEFRSSTELVFHCPVENHL